MFGMGPSELVIIGIIAVLLFGRKLPDVAKSLGSSYREFRKGLQDLQSQMNVNDSYSSSYSSRSSSYSESSTYSDFDDRDEVTAPKFEPPPAEPQATGDEVASSVDEVAPSGEAASVGEDNTPSGEIEKNISEK